VVEELINHYNVGDNGISYRRRHVIPPFYPESNYSENHTQHITNIFLIVHVPKSLIYTLFKTKC